MICYFFNWVWNVGFWVWSFVNLWVLFLIWGLSQNWSNMVFLLEFVWLWICVCVYVMLCNLVQLIFLCFFFLKDFCIDFIWFVHWWVYWFFMKEGVFVLAVLNLLWIIGMREREREKRGTIDERGKGREGIND